MTSESITIITGLSGAGISSVLKTLEDTGLEVFDNFPVSLVQALVDDTPPGRKIAIGIDTRSRGFSPEAVQDLVQATKARLLFITCDNTILQRRFSETRRRHPLAVNKSVKAGIAAERDLLSPLQEQADFTIDTTDLSIHDLKHVLREYLDVDQAAQLSVNIVSFGFKHGLPRGADIVMDVRFLTNPYWEKDLRAKTGKDAAVGAFIQKDAGYEEFWARFKGLLDTLLPRYTQEGKSYLTIAIGCTGGRHRSVFVAETLKAWLQGENLHPYVEHRDLRG